MDSIHTIPGGTVTTPLGYRANGLHCGLKRTSRYDLGVLVSDVPASAAAVYTLNKVQAAPLQVTKDSLQGGKLQAVVVNSGNANACTGQQGLDDAYNMRSATADALAMSPETIAVSSTGVIGELLPMDKVLSGIARLPKPLSTDGGSDFSQAILTTDLVEKNIAVSCNIDGKEVRIGGVAKGSGMIHPNMATMLAYVTTDAVIDSVHLQQVLSSVTDLTFNMITVDGDTSTNDTAIALANGMAGHDTLHPAHPDWDVFVAAFQFVAEHLAKQIARDGEGATKLVEVHVDGATTDESARRIAKTIIGSSLVKSAIFGADANWGRIIAATGRAGEPMNPDTVDIRIGDFEVLHQSRPVAFDDEQATNYLQKEELIQIFVSLHQGSGQATAWGCDLTYEYVRINAAYRT